MRALICIVGFLVHFHAIAGIETQVSYMNGTAFLDYAIHGGNTVPNTFAYSELTDFNPAGNTDWENNYKILSSKGRVELYIDGSAMPLFFKYALEVPVEITYYKIDHTYITLTHKLRVDYDPVEGSYHRQLDMWQLDGVFAIKVRVKGDDPSIHFFADSPLSTGQKEAIANVVKIRVTQEYDKVINFDYVRALLWNEMYFNYKSSDRQLDISWMVIEGAETYDLEWCYVEKYLEPFASVNGPLTNATFSFSENNTRVTLTTNTYTLPIVYERGALVFRVRAKGKVLPDTEHTVIGPWSCGSLGGCNSYDNINPSFNFWRHTFWMYDAHENDNKNWQVVTSYAEDGKRKDVVNYMDGTMRTRQTVTVNNTDNNVLVAETFYDHQGRPAVQVLPAPVIHDPALKFRANFNRNLSNQPYSRLDFDMDGQVACSGTSGQLNSVSGAAHYYSSQFFGNLTPAEKESHLAYIPESSGYPIIQTEYTPDNTGRIQRQGGAGSTFQLESTHETKYFYATPAQEELDYLFGTNVGQASHYKKNMVMDPNGQVSISYMDAKGNTIATALAGTAPLGLDQLDSYAPFPMTINLLAYNRKDTIDYSLDATFTLAVDSRGDHQFYYGVTAEQFVDNCTPSDVCYDCIYDLELLVVSNECMDTFYHFTKTIGTFFTVDPTTTSTPSTGGGGSARLTLGAISLDSLSFGLNTSCGTPVHFNTGMLPQNNAFTVLDMPVGTYSVIKRLKVNQDAAHAYLEHYLNDPNNVCTNVLEDMLNEQLDLVDTDDCYLDCDDVDQTSTDPDDMELAEAVCDTVLSNPCDIALEVMKAHMTPGGQYAEFDAITYNGNAKPLSIFNISSYLKLPQLRYIDMDFNGITTINDLGNVVSPATLGVQEFIFNCEESWLVEMVKYHPEYCMYERCRDSLYDANDYANLLHETETLADAFTNNLISGPLVPFNILDNDIYFGSGQVGALKYNEMQAMMLAFPDGNPGQPSIWDLAAANAFCGGGIYDIDCMDDIDITYLQTQAPQPAADYFWATYKSLYITLREKIEYKKRVAYAMDPRNCYNECIGKLNFSPFRNNFMYFTTNWTGEYFNDVWGTDGVEPCNSDIYFYFHDKVKAFPSPYDMLPDMELDFWDTPTWQMAQHVIPTLPVNPCDTCSCKDEMSHLLNVLLMDLLADQLANGVNINDITMPLAQAQVMFNKMNVGYTMGGTGDITFAEQNNEIVIQFGVNNSATAPQFCRLNTGLTLTELLATDSISVLNCPNLNETPPATGFYFTTYDYLGNPSPKEIRANFNQCRFSCKNTPVTKDTCETLNVGLTFFNLLQEIQSTDPISGIPFNGMYDMNDGFLSQELKDTLMAHGWSTQDTLINVSATPQGITITLIPRLCSIMIYMPPSNTAFGGSAISHFANFEPNFNTITADGLTYAFTFDVIMMDGTTIKASGSTQGCIPVGRCCKGDDKTDQRISNARQRPAFETRKKNVSVDNNKVITQAKKGQIKPGKGDPANLSNPYPLPTIPKPKPKPFDPLCDDCMTIDLTGSLLDTVFGPPCNENIWCDTSLLVTIELDSIPNPCAEHLYNVAAANAYMLYEAFVDSVSIAFLHAYNMKCLQATEAMRGESGFAQHHFTLYYYDQSNNLVQTVPPNGVQGLDATEMDAMAVFRENNRTYITPNPVPVVNSISSQWTSNYRFNSLNQITSQKIPDQGIFSAGQFVKEATVFWYDKLGRLVCSASPEQRSKNEYAYTIYDDLGRIREVGVVNSNIPPPFSPVNTNDNPWIVFLSGTKTQITTTTYDLDFYDGTLPPGFPLPELRHLRGRVSAAAVYDTKQQLTDKKPQYITHYSYDIHGNVEAVIQDGNNTPRKLMEYDYDLISDKVNAVYYQKNRSDQFIHKYQYDADNRLIIARTSANGIHWDEDAHYQYYPHGPLARSEIGEDEIQGIDYAYMLQGWIKGVNSASLRTNTDMGHDGLEANEHKYFGQDVSGYILNYFNGDYQNIGQSAAIDKFEGNMGGNYALTTTESMYNGNIRAMVTAIRPFMLATGSPAGYKYQYDQLHRIKGMDYFIDMANNDWSPASIQTDYQTRYSYDANGNILSLDRNATSMAGNQLDMDKLSYTYAEGNNRLTHVNDVINATNYPTDIDNQATNNYQYDRNGNLIRDNAEGLTIEWNLSGKVSQITKDNGTIITFRYDALGNRIMKSHNDTLTWYVRDASGNPMAHYGNTGIPMTTVGPNGSVTVRSFELQSWTLYGSSRLGEFKPYLTDPRLTESETDTGPGGSGTGGAGSARLYKAPKPLKLQNYRGRKQYELTNHLGNVLATVSDRKLFSATPVAETGLFAHVITASDYYPEGMQMPFRTYETAKYKFKHQGQVSDAEVYGEGNSYFYKYRMSDSRLGRFWSVDPLFQKYPYYSNYQFSGNKLISHGELEGLEEEDKIYLNSSDKLATDKNGYIEMDENNKFLFQSVEPANVWGNNLDNFTSFVSQLSNLEGVVSTFTNALTVAAKEEMKIIYRYGTKGYSSLTLTNLNKESWNYVNKQVGIVGKEVGKLGYPLIIADAAYNSNLKHSHVINATLIAFSGTGFGGILAGAYFITDVGIGIITEKSLSQRIDEDWFKTPLVDLSKYKLIK